MQTRNRNTFTTIHTEGALLPVDLLQRISENNKNLEGLNPESYHLAPGEKLNEAINRSWNRLSGLWGAFQAARGRLGSTDPLGGGSAGTTLTRERWLLPLFQELGFGRLSTSKAVEIEGKSYPISHRWLNVPLHLVGCGIELDKRTPGAVGAARTSPHSLMQEYLNRSDDVQWGVISNGLELRILRDNATLTRQAYIEFDLESMFDGEIYSDFVLLWLICHQSRFETTEKQTECLLEKWSKSAQESGTRALDDLRRGVEEAIVSFGQGFLQHPLNGELRSQLKNGDLSAQDYYRQLLRLVYRLIFLFAAEDRDLLLLPGAAVEAQQRFLNYYSTTRLRALAQRQRGSRHHDRYEALRLVMTLLGSDSGCPELAIPALGGFLFDARSTADLNEARLDNQALLSSVRSLAFITEGNTRRAVDYRNLGPEELGSVYESLLELHPVLNTDAGTFQLTSAAGNERKTTGSYYTPSSLIQVLLDSALDPVIQDRLKGKQDAAQQEQALLELKVCDPACGSGHFLIAAAHRIAGWLAEVRAGDNEPSPNETRRALRDVIRHCIYGVDLNPMAVELCKVNLWLESLEPGKPLSFLDAHIKCGNSLVGVGPGMEINELEVPDEAYNPVTGDDKAAAALLKKRNKQERSGQESLFVTVLKTREDLDAWLAERARAVENMPEENAAEVQAKAEAYQKVSESVEYRRRRQMADLWTAAFFWKIEEPKGRLLEMVAPTHGQLRRLRTGGQPQAGLLQQVERLSQAQGFFHWPLEFAEAAAAGGFDCVLGNPPFNADVSESKKFISYQYAGAATSNTAALFIFLAISIIKPDCSIGLVCPKSITYSMRWKKIREFITPGLYQIIDCQQAWSNVLLEQVLLSVQKEHNNSLFTSGVYTNGEISLQRSFSKKLIEKYDVIFVDIDDLLIDLLQRDLDFISLGSFARTKRGLGLQRQLQKSGATPVIGGKDISRYSINSVSGYLSEQTNIDVNLFRKPKAIFQNIIAHVMNPKPHIKLIGTVDKKNMICLDTVNMITSDDERIAPEFIVGLLNSHMINWLVYRLLYNKAIRTMHFDQFFLDKILIPSNLVSLADSISNKVSTLMKENWIDESSEGYFKTTSEIDRIILSCYGLNDQEVHEVISDFVNIDLLLPSQFVSNRSQETINSQESVSLLEQNPETAGKEPETTNKQDMQPTPQRERIPLMTKSVPPTSMPSPEPLPAQPTLSDFGLYKCEVCGKMVMGFEKVNHEQEKHGGKSVDWKKMR